MYSERKRKGRLGRKHGYHGGFFEDLAIGVLGGGLDKDYGKGYREGEEQRRWENVHGKEGETERGERDHEPSSRRSYSSAPSCGPSRSTAPGSELDTAELMGMALGTLLVVGLIIWMFSCVGKALSSYTHPAQVSVPATRTPPVPPRISAFVSNRMENNYPGPAIEKLDSQQGARQTIYIAVLADGEHSQSPIPLLLELYRDNVAIFKRTSGIQPGSPGMVMSWADEFMTGHYVARVFAQDRLVREIPFLVEGSDPPPKTETVATCSKARAFGDFDAKADFSPGEELWIYAQVTNVNRAGRIDLTFEFAVYDQSNTQLLVTTYPVDASNATGLSQAAWNYFALPQDFPSGSFTARVAVTDNVSHLSAIGEVPFRVVDSKP